MRLSRFTQTLRSFAIVVLLPLLLLATIGSSCDIINETDSGPPDGDADGDGDEDGDGDGDADSDADGDTDADGDSDADADGDGDADADGDGDGDGDGDSDADSDADADGEGLIDELIAILSSSSSSAAEVRQALYDVAWGGGWPLHEDGRWLFATEWGDTPDSVALVGDFNGWEPATHPAQMSPSGPFYWAVLDAGEVATPEGAKYKWWGAADIWRAPPEATAYGYDEFGPFGWVRPSTAEPHLERFPAHDSAFLDEPRSLRAWLPAGFVPGSPEAGHHRTLLLHDGQNVFHPDGPWGGWRVDETLASEGYSDVIVLAVDNGSDRFDAYTHVPDDVFGDGSMIGGDADSYIRSLRDEVLPFFRSRYGVEAAGASLMISGSSLGGLVTLYMVIDEPDFQACAAALSPSLFWGAVDPALTGGDAIVNLWPGAVGHGSSAIYLDSGGGPESACLDGDGDGVDDDGDDSDNYCVTAQLRDAMIDVGYAFDVDLWHWFEPDAPHNEAAWAERFHRALAACDAGGWAAP